MTKTGGDDSDDPDDIKGYVVQKDRSVAKKRSTPNGASKVARQIVTIGSAVTCFVLIFLEFIYGGTLKAVPIWLYCLLVGVSLFSNDRLYTILEMILSRNHPGGGK